MSQISRRKFIKTAGMSGLLAFAPRNNFFSFNKFIADGGLNASIRVDTSMINGKISDNIYGQFIEHLGRAIYGGIFDEKSPASNKAGIRLDVMQKVKELRPPLLRYPGGTFTKIYHWMDGVGPLNERKGRPNLIWGGIDNNHFGTDEYILYCRAIGAEPFLVVNMSTGTAEEAGNWVEYCNGVGDTYYANLRRKHGHKEPFNVKFWGIGNEEGADKDIGRLQKPEKFVEDAWLWVKMMKLQDKHIKLIFCGAEKEWNREVLKSLHAVCDYISLHCYVSTDKGKPASIFAQVTDVENIIISTKKLIDELAPATEQTFDKWYRFPPRRQPTQIAIDELGIWEQNDNIYNLENSYNWNHALATATLYNIIQRQANSVGMATWAQTVNVLAPIMTNKTTSVRQTIFYAMKFYRDYSGNLSVKAEIDTPELNQPGAENTKALDISVTLNAKNGTMILLVVNRHPSAPINTEINITNAKTYNNITVRQLNAVDIYATNSLDQPAKNVVIETQRNYAAPMKEIIFAPHSITALIYS